MKKLPMVSIVIPVYNGWKYMREAIDSALAQTYKNIEIIVVNDGSNDNGKTDKIALSYGDKIRYFKKGNGGVSTALNLAIKNMKGEYFSWLSHDDVYYHDKIEKQINYTIFNNYEDENIIFYGDYDLIDSKSRLITRCTKDHQMLIEKPEYALLRGSINGITLLIPKRAFDEFGLFDENLRCTQDYEMWQRMSKDYIIEHMEGIVAKSRQHGKQESIKNPRVLIEGDKLWIDMITSLSKKAMERLEGSEYNFYKEMAKFLADSPYKEVQKLCEDKCAKIGKRILKTIDDIKVSVIIPFYNRVDLAINSIESVLAQTHKNIEILVVNDGSTENVTNLTKFIKDKKQIKFINIEKNQGASNARNVGIDEATGDYVAFLDSDDLFKSNKIEVQLYQMVVTESNVSHTSYLRKGFNQEIIIHSGRLSGKAIPTIIYNCGIATPTVMIKKSYLDKNKFRYNTNLVIGEDVCFWLEILRNTNIVGIDDDLTIVDVVGSSAAYNVDKQIIGMKTILTYVLNDDEYNKYSYELALLCNAYINIVSTSAETSINGSSVLCPHCIEIMDSRSWKVTKPLRMFMQGMRSIKDYGIVMTFKKTIKKIQQHIKKGNRD